MGLLNDIDSEAELEELRKTARRLSQQLNQERSRRRLLFDAVYQAARDASLVVGPPPKLPSPKFDRRKKSSLVPILHTTDHQYGKRTESYNLDVADRRMKELGDKVCEIIEIQKNGHPINEAVVLIGGDCVEGVNIFPGQHFEIDAGLFEQVFRVRAALRDLIIRKLLTAVPKITVYCSPGNHGRLSKRGDYSWEDNSDILLYRILADDFNDEPRVTFHVPTTFFAHFTVGQYKAAMVHGDQIRQFGGNTPSYGIMTKAHKWASGVLPFFMDLYMGHFHSPQQMTLANGGSVFITGSPESGNNYAAEFIASTALASQRLHFAHPDDGIIASQHQVWLRAV